MDDVTPELLEAVRKKFNFFVENNITIKKLKDKVKKGLATYKEADQYSLMVGNALSKAYKSELRSNVLPDGKMYFNIASRIFDNTLKNNHEIISRYCEDVQKGLNKSANVGLKIKKPKFNDDRAKGLIELASNSDVYDEVADKVEEGVINFSQNVVAESIKENAELQSDAGLETKVVRIAEAGCCKWCTELEGTYEYPDVPDDVFKRHANCRCIIDAPARKKKK